ncbi:MBL fold metallo-hydrolase [Bdellovibrio sp. SKB1291214]|nr:MBL fold metallo-hydrolase [Bdellovibrio sp. SKB1291214]UYL09422.1 MBL fold metallo-hydrolase [Bdellovibrio sp. SKB1291214]
MDGISPSSFQRGHLCNHCLLLETNNSLVLVDTGFGTRDVQDPGSRLSSFFLQMLAPEFKGELTAIRQIESLGFDPRDVQDIILTHLDFDHAGGLDDFPQARVHMLDAEKRSAEMQETWLDRQRYRPQQWNYKQNWKTHPSTHGESWFGFKKVTPLPELQDQIALVPLAGHTLGHAGVAINTGGQWLLNAGDAYFYKDEMNYENPNCTPGLEFYQTLMEKDRGQRKDNQRRLREIKKHHGTEVEIFCSHDNRELEELKTLERTPYPLNTGQGKTAQELNSESNHHR